MRLEPETLRELPLHMQEQVALAFVPPAKAPPNPVAGQPKNQRVTVRRLRFVSKVARIRYGELLNLAKHNMVRQIVMRENEDGFIDRFLYITKEIYGK